jgi:hypothetical protein
MLRGDDAVSGIGLVMNFVNSMAADVATSHAERIVRFFNRRHRVRV